MRRGRLALGALALMLLTGARAQAPVTWDELSEPLPTYGYIVRPGITPEHLALNIEGFTLSALEISAYGGMLRARGLTLKREATLKETQRHYTNEHKILMMYLAWLQDAVEHAPRPGKLRSDGVDRWVAELSSDAFETRRPVASDFKLKRREVPESLRGKDMEPQPGELEFGNGKP
jgi:hypothetical protein